MRTIFVILYGEPAGLQETDELERLLKLMLGRRLVDHTSRSYWDDGTWETEYGVRLDIKNVPSDEEFQRLLGEIVIVTAELYGSIRIQLG